MFCNCVWYRQEKYAEEIGCLELRIDTNAVNVVARRIYKKRGYTEVGIVPTEFNGIAGVNLVLLEKYIGRRTGTWQKIFFL